jgi:hypothetical protein
LQLDKRRDIVVDDRAGRLFVELDLDDPSLVIAPATRVARDRVQPRARRFGLRPALQRGVGVQERDLRQVLRVLAVARKPEDGPEDL